MFSLCLQCTVFVCNDWIRSDQPEVYPSVELIPGRPIPLVLRYRLDIVTADVKGAATTSNVFVEMHGQGGKIGPVQLDNPTAFQKGQVGCCDLILCCDVQCCAVMLLGGLHCFLYEV